MGSSISKLGNWSDTSANITFVGLENAGKKTILDKIELKSDPTPGVVSFRTETVRRELVPGLTMTVFDIPGIPMADGKTMRPFRADGIIWIVDSSDIDRLAESRKELLNVLNEHIFYDPNAPDDTKSTPVSTGVPILVYANKQDLPGAIKPNQLAEKLELDKLRNKWHIQGTNAITGDGLCEGIQQFSKEVKNYIKNNRP